MFRVTSLVDSKSDREYLVNLLKGADGRKRPFDPGLVRLRIEDPDLGLIQVDKRGTVQFETKEPIGLGSARFESLQGFFYLNFPQNSAVTYLTPKYKD